MKVYLYGEIWKEEEEIVAGKSPSERLKSLSGENDNIANTAGEQENVHELYRSINQNYDPIGDDAELEANIYTGEDLTWE